MSSSGQFRIARDIFYDWTAEDRPWCSLALWLYIIGRGQYRDTTVVFLGHRFLLTRGQLVTSTSHLCEVAGWTRQRLRTFLSRCQKDGKIIVTGGEKGTVISILNYDKWQGFTKQPTKQPALQPTQQPTPTQSMTDDMPIEQPALQPTQQPTQQPESIEGVQYSKCLVSKVPLLPTPKTRTARVTFDKSSGLFVGLSEDLQSKLRTTYPGVDLPQVIREAQLWAADNRRSDYWGSLKAFCEHSNKGGANGHNKGRGYRPSIEDAVFTGEDFIHDPHS